MPHALGFVQNLSAGALSVHDVARDGNCLFEALGFHYKRGVGKSDGPDPSEDPDGYPSYLREELQAPQVKQLFDAHYPGAYDQVLSLQDILR